MGKQTEQARGDAVERTRMPWGRASIGVLLAALTLSLTGCPSSSPCDDSFVDGNGQCPEGCEGLSVFHIVDVCRNWTFEVPPAEGRWCTETRGTRPALGCVIEEASGEMYMTRWDPDSYPSGVRACTTAEWTPPECAPPTAP